MGDMSQDAWIFIWMYVDLVYQLESLVYYNMRLCALIFHFLFFFEFFMLIWISVKPKFDQHLNKFETWKWKTKPGSFLVTPKWSFCEVLENFMFQIQNLFSSLQETQFETGRYEPRYMNFHLNVCRPCLSTWIISIWHYKTMCVGFTFFWCFMNILCIFEFRSNLGLTNI